MYDEPFAGLDLVSMGVAAKLIRTLNDVTGDLDRRLARRARVHGDQRLRRAHGRAGGRIVAQGTPAELMASTDAEVRQFVRGEPDGPVKFHYPAPRWRTSASLNGATQ